MAAALALNAAAKASVAKLCDTLITRQSFFPIFDESRGAADYARWRKDLLTCVQSVGAGFKESLLYTGSVPEATIMTDANIMLDTADGHTQLTMPQMRQQAMLIVIRLTLSPDGESMRLIADCVHAGGVVQRQQVHDQALRLLDRRWHSADAPTFDASKESKLLNSMGENWPAEFSVDAYNNHFNLAVSRASRCHLNPLNDDPESMQLRSLWWGAFADPPVESPYFMAAQEARAVTGQHNTTMAHRTAWQAAMIKSITTFVKAGVGKAVGGLSRGQVSARYGGFVPPGLDVDAYAAAAPRAFPGGGRGDGPPRTKLCVRCPLQADGKLTVHDRSFKCDAMADCTGCGSNGHLEHSCWIIHGVPPGTKISAGFHDELTRLHALQKIGKFDWMTTPTTLRWMESARLRKGASAGSVAASVAGMCEDMEAEMAYAESCGFQPLPLSTGPTAMLPATPVIYPGVVGGNVAESIAGSGVSDVYRSMLAFDGIVGGNAASANDVHEHVWRASSANCGTCGDRAGEMCGGCSATWCSCPGLVVPPPRGVPTPRACHASCSPAFPLRSSRLRSAFCIYG
jgi:hypothetical protein